MSKQSIYIIGESFPLLYRVGSGKVIKFSNIENLIHGDILFIREY